MITRFIVLALVIFIIFRVFYFIHKAFHYLRHVKHHVNYILPVFELFTWIGYLIWCTSHAYEAENYKGLIMLGVLCLVFAIPSFYLLRDFIFGVYFRMQQQINKGDFVDIEDIKGEILETGNFNFEMKDKQGDIKTIPYSKIKSKIIARHGSNPNLKKQILEFRFPEHLKINKIKSELEKNLLTSPWVAVSQPPFIENIKHENGEYIFEVAMFTLSNEYAENIREMVENSLSKTK